MYYNFLMTLLRCHHFDIGKRFWAKLRDTPPWRTPGAYLRKSMLMTLARATTQLSDEEIARLVEKHTSATDETMAPE